MKCAKAESLKRPRPQSSLTLFPSTLFTSPILLSFLMVGTMLAQNESVSVQVGAEDRAAGTYATSNFRYRILRRGPWPEVLLEVPAPPGSLPGVPHPVLLQAGSIRQT